MMYRFFGLFSFLVSIPVKELLLPLAENNLDSIVNSVKLLEWIILRSRSR